MTFELVCAYRLAPGDAGAARDALAERFADQRDVRGVVVRPRAGEGEGEDELRLMVESGSLSDAIDRAQALVDGLVADLRGRLGCGAVEAGAVEPADDCPELDRLLDTMLSIDLEELAALADGVEDGVDPSSGGAGCPVSAAIAAAVRAEGLPERGAPVVLGKRHRADYARDVDGPWGRTASDAGTVVFHLDGSRWETGLEEGVASAARLTRALARHGHVAAVFERLDEWLPREHACRTTREHARGRASLVLLPLADSLDLLRFFGTRAERHGLEPDDVLARLQRWRSEASFVVVAAGEDHATLAFDTLPADVDAFADEVVAFAPDTVEQLYVGPPTSDTREIERAMETQGAAELAASLRRARLLRLWWD